MSDYDIYFKNKFQLLKFAGMKFSWMMAAEKCHQYGMTLPHLQNEEKTREFILYIHNKYVLPIYTLFVGLVTKVCTIGVSYSSIKMLLITYLEIWMTFFSIALKMSSSVNYKRQFD